MQKVRRERLIYHLEKCGQMVVMLLPPVVLDSKFLFVIILLI